MPHSLSRLLPRLLLMIAGLTLIGADVSSGQPAPPTAGASTYSTAPFGTVHLFRPSADPRGVVLFLSDSNGVSTTETSIATTLAHRGLLVALVSTPVLMATPDAWSKRCLNANYPLVDLSNDVQHRAGVKAYMKPVILGTGEGGTLAYASLAQWPNGSYQGVVSVGFSPQIASARPWCTAPGFSAEHVQEGTAWRFGPNKRSRLPWIALSAPGSGGPALGMLPVPDMPLTLVPARKTTANRDVMAIVYSGDGGWAGIDRDVAGQLANAGIPVVGVDSLSYFWTARTPTGAARDLRQLILSFSQHWKRPRVLLVGYSFGADTLPLMVDALDGPARARIARMSLLGLSATADFQFHLSSWLDISSDNGLPTVPAVTRLRGLPMQCVRGEDESDSACPQIPAGLAQQYLVPGGHHFDRNAPLLTQIVLGARRPGTISD